MGPSERADHGEYEQLAVEHVLGGLDQETSSRFRAHLSSCRDCRQRVVELRGIAADLEVAEREERRAAAATKVETARREAEPPESGGDGGRWRTAAIAGLLLAAVAVAILAFWNLHLRDVRTALEQSLSVRGEVLDLLLEGDVVAATSSADGVVAQLAKQDDRLAINATGLVFRHENQRVAVWTTDAEGKTTPLVTVGKGSVPDGRLALVIRTLGVERVVVTVETFPLGPVPRGTTMLTVDLP